jgi:hypothetical protein
MGLLPNSNCWRSLISSWPATVAKRVRAVMLPRADERWMTKGPCTTSVLQRCARWSDLLSQQPSSSAAAAPPVPHAHDGASVKVDATRCACKRLGEILQPSTTYTATNTHARSSLGRALHQILKNTTFPCTRGILIPDVCYETHNCTTINNKPVERQQQERAGRGVC